MAPFWLGDAFKFVLSLHAIISRDILERAGRLPGVLFFLPHKLACALFTLLPKQFGGVFKRLSISILLDLFVNPEYLLD